MGQTKAPKALQTLLFYYPIGRDEIFFCLLIFSQHFDCSRTEVAEVVFKHFILFGLFYLPTKDFLDKKKNKAKSPLLILHLSQTILYSFHNSIKFQKGHQKNYTICLHSQYLFHTTSVCPFMQPILKENSRKDNGKIRQKKPSKSLFCFVVIHICYDSLAS